MNAAEARIAQLEHGYDVLRTALRKREERIAELNEACSNLLSHIAELERDKADLQAEWAKSVAGGCVQAKRIAELERERDELRAKS